MIIADPFGSWVQGAHEGQQDAIAMRQAQDKTAQENYALHRQAAFDPMAYQQEQNKTATSNLELGQNQKIYGDNIPYHLAQAGQESAQLKNAEGRVSLGDTAAYVPFAAANGGQTTAGGIRYPIVGPDGQTHYVATPYGNITNPSMYRTQGMQDYNYEKAIQRQQQIEETQRRDEARGKVGYGGVPQGGYMQIPGAPPVAHVTPQQNIYSGINLNQPSQ